MQGSQTLGKTKKKNGSQRHSAGNIDYDNIQTSQEAEDVPILLHNQQQTHMMQQQNQMLTTGFRSRSKTVGDATGKFTQNLRITSSNQHIIFIISILKFPKI